ncbi:MAG: RNA signal recognition particle [Burkholderiales bacterium RIFCSPLOWO2_02_FULL_57_36]|nr:MAG: RNA signal recognition particle [Burkholderiales bacterium RIFCSPLOWO2_02_FULL_57_36]
MPYVDGFILPLPKKNVEAYREIASKSGAIWREHGALQFRECIADDIKPGKLTSFPQSVNLEADETVIFSWIVYESRAHRDEVNDKVMKDPRMADMMNPASMPFDGKRMIYGGFEVLVDL